MSIQTEFAGLKAKDDDITAAPETPIEAGPVVPAPPIPVEKPVGWDLVDYSKIPDDVRGVVKDRIDRLYGQVKTNEREREEERKHYQRLEAKLDLMMKSQDVKDVETKIDVLSEKAKKQLSDGDYDTGIKTLRQLAKLEREKPTFDADLPDPDEVVGKAETPERPPISEYDTNKIMGFFDSVRGALPVGSPLQKEAIDFISEQLAYGVSVDDAIKLAQGTIQFMADEKLKATPPPAPVGKPPIVQQVLGQNQAIQGSKETKTPKLSEEQKKVALKFFPQLKPDEAVAKYARYMG